MTHQERRGRKGGKERTSGGHWVSFAEAKMEYGSARELSRLAVSWLSASPGLGRQWSGQGAESCFNLNALYRLLQVKIEWCSDTTVEAV